MSPLTRALADKELVVEADELDGLSDWEVRFVRDLLARDKFPLTVKQRTIVLQIINERSK